MPSFDEINDDFILNQIHGILVWTQLFETAESSCECLTYRPFFKRKQVYWHSRRLLPSFVSSISKCPHHLILFQENCALDNLGQFETSGDQGHYEFFFPINNFGNVSTFHLKKLFVCIEQNGKITIRQPKKTHVVISIRRPLEALPMCKQCPLGVPLDIHKLSRKSALFGWMSKVPNKNSYTLLTGFRTKV